jgi:hypothetical protein
MNAIEAIAGDGLTIKSCTHYLPGVGIDDRGKWVPMSLTARESGINRRTLQNAINRGAIVAQKDVRGVWMLRLRSFTKWFERYRKSPRWSARDLEILWLPLTSAEVAKVLRRSERSIRIKRCRLRISICKTMGGR